MKKIKSILIKIKAKATLKTYQKPLLVTIISLLIINLIILLIGSIVMLNVDDSGYFEGKFISAFATCMKCMISANSINTLTSDGAGLKLIICAAIIIGIEMVIFSGAIVATLTAALKGFVDKKSQAQGKINVENHFVILNWNSKVPDIVYNLLVKGFKNNIVILSNKTKEYVTAEIESVISTYSDNKKKKKVNLIIKNGNPLLRGSLEDISIEKASNIVIMSREDMSTGDDINISNSDLYSLKIMLSLGNFNINSNCNIVVETDTESTKQKIENLSLTVNSLKNKSIIPISFNQKIGQIIAQSIINPVMAPIYLELLSYDGFEFYSYENIELDDYIKKYNSAIPIINFGNLFVLAEDYADISKTRQTEYKTNKALKFINNKHLDKFSIFVIGENKKSNAIIKNLDLFKKLPTSQFSIKTYKKDDIYDLIEDIKETEGIRKVLILSDDTVSNDSYDANVFVTLIALQNAFPKRENISFITELLDSRNLNSVKDFNIQNAIISNRMMSLLITQLALNKNSKKFFNGLLTVDTDEGGDFFDIKISKVDEILDTNQDLTFKTKADLIQSFYYGSSGKYMLIGYIRNESIYYLASKQDDEFNFVLNSDDSLIYIEY